MDNIHGEPFLLVKSILDGAVKKGDTVRFQVMGKMPVCDLCIVHLPIFANKKELAFMTVLDGKAGILYYWKPGMNKLQRLGKFSSIQSGK